MARQEAIGHRLPDQRHHGDGCRRCGEGLVVLVRGAVLSLLIALVAFVVASVAPAHATTIERVVSPGGIEAWLVHEPSVPLIAIDFAFSGGAIQDPAAKTGP